MQPRQRRLFMKLVWGYFQTKRRISKFFSFLFFGEEYTKSLNRKKLENLSLQQIEAATTLKEIKVAHLNAPSDRTCKESYEKWIKFTQRKIDSATTVEEIREVSFDGFDCKMAYPKWVQLSQQEVAVATTIEQIEAAFNRAPGGCKAQVEALLKINTLLGQPAGTPVAVFVPKGNWHEDDCINTGTNYICTNESTLQATFYDKDFCLVYSVRCCTNQVCKDIARELVLTQIKNGKRR